MFQAVFALGIVLITLVYAVFSMVRFMLPVNKNKAGDCSGGSCNCSGSGEHKNQKRSKAHPIRTIKLN